jgi:parallel beta-helix repeat protein
MNMKGMVKGFLLGAVLFLVMLPCFSDAIPQKINYQGYLTNAAGTPVNETVQMRFSIYNTSSEGTALWTETQNVMVANGVYNVNLGDVTPITLAFEVPYYLGVSVGTDPEMTPRKIFTAVGYAFRALAADTVVGSGSFTSPIVSTVSTGTAPLQVNSTTNVANLNADMLDGQHGSEFAPTDHKHPVGDLTGTLPIGSGGTNATTASQARTNLSVPGLSTANTFVTGTQTIEAGKPYHTGVVVRGAAAQSANLQEWQNGGGTVVASLDPGGKFTGDGSGLSGVEKRTTISACGTISESGSYYVTQNLTTTGTCITVAANDVTIDLNGFTLTGDGGTDDYGIYINNVSNVEVRNGTVRGLGRGIYASWSGTATKSNRVINLRAMGNGYGIYLSSYNNLIKDCTVADSTDASGYGVYTSYGSTVVNNTAYNNQSTGIYAYNGSTVMNNTASYNENVGIYTIGGTTVMNNTVYYNQSYGIYAISGSTVTNNTVRSNNQSDSTSSGGIFVSVGCIVKNNTVRANLQNNIYVSSGDNAIEENLVTGSGNGIYFDSAGNFYANNRARGNTTNYNTDGHYQYDGGGNVEF